MLVRKNLARTTEPAKLVLQTESTNVCVFPDLLAMTVKTVGNIPSQFSKKGFGRSNREEMLKYIVQPYFSKILLVSSVKCGRVYCEGTKL